MGRRLGGAKTKVGSTEGRAEPERCQGGSHNKEAEAWEDGSRQLMGRVGQLKGLAAQG